jgi:hypothetical protein
VRVRVFLTGAAERKVRVALQPELARLQSRMLTGENERRCDAPIGQGAGEGRQLDGFGPGADDQPDVRETQSSP